MRDGPLAVAVATVVTARVDTEEGTLARARRVVLLASLLLNCRTDSYQSANGISSLLTIFIAAAVLVVAVPLPLKRTDRQSGSLCDRCMAGGIDMYCERTEGTFHHPPRPFR